MQICTVLPKTIENIYISFSAQSPTAGTSFGHQGTLIPVCLPSVGLHPQLRTYKTSPFLKQKTAKLRRCLAPKSSPWSLLGKTEQSAAATVVRLFRMLQNKYSSPSKTNWIFSSLCFGFPPVILAATHIQKSKSRSVIKVTRSINS